MLRYRAIAEYYDHENDNLRMLQQDVPMLLRHMPRSPQDVLELAVGTGRAAIPLAQAGHRVVGADYAADMLAIAQRKRDAVGLGPRELKLLRSNVLTLRLRQRFDWICILFNTLLGFVSLEDQDRLLETVVRHLRPRGRFWVDVFHPDYARMARSRERRIDPRLFFVPRYDRSVLRTVDVDRDMARQVHRVTFDYQWHDPRGRRRRAQRRFDMTFMTPRELRLLLERHGLEIERIWGDYDDSELSADSPRMIAMCRKMR